MEIEKENQVLKDDKKKVNDARRKIMCNIEEKDLEKGKNEND